MHSSKFSVNHLWLWILFLALSLLPWLYLFGLSAQPARFIWTPILVIIVLCSLFFESALITKSWYTVFSKSILVILLTTLISERYYKHSFRIKLFSDSQSQSLDQWYDHEFTYQYSFGQKFKELNLQNERVLYLEPIPLGVFPISEYNKLPTAKELNLYREGFETYKRSRDYIFVTKNDLINRGIDTTHIVLKRGEFYLLKQEKSRHD